MSNSNMLLVPLGAAETFVRWVTGTPEDGSWWHVLDGLECLLLANQNISVS